MTTVAPDTAGFASVLDSFLNQPQSVALVPILSRTFGAEGTARDSHRLTSSRALNRGCETMKWRLEKLPDRRLLPGKAGRPGKKTKPRKRQSKR